MTFKHIGYNFRRRCICNLNLTLFIVAIVLRSLLQVYFTCDDRFGLLHYDYYYLKKADLKLVLLGYN